MPALPVALLAFALAASPELEQTARPIEQPWQVWTGLSSGVRSGDGAAMGEGWIGVSRFVLPHLRPELDLGLGYAGGPQEVLTSIRVGLAYEVELGRVAPYAWLAFAHNHESAWENAKRDPIPVVFGLSENGVVHRTGAEAGGGINLALGRSRGDAVEGVLGLRATAAALLGDGPALAFNGLVSVGLRF